MATTLVQNCSFVTNNVSIVLDLYNGNVVNCGFTNNTISSAGIKTENGFTGIVSGCSFASNACSGSFGGGGLRLQDGTVSNCTFVGNSSLNGGAIYVAYTPGNNFKTITGCNFVNNKGKGGAIYWGTGTGTVNNCSFVGNSAANPGGAVYFGLTNVVTVSNCGFTNNYCTGNNQGGAIDYSAPTTASLVLNCSFSGNSNAVNNAGAIYAYNAAISNCVFSNNMCGAGGQGGALYLANSSTVQRCLFVGNYTSNQPGGAIFCATPAGQQQVIQNCGFFGNQAGTKGGALYVTNSSALPNILDSCTFAANYAGTLGAGGAVYQDTAGSFFYATNCIFYTNACLTVSTDVFLLASTTGVFWNCCISKTNGYVGAAAFTNCFIVNPLFANNGTGFGTNLLNGTYDFRLKMNSPCRDAGTNETWMTGAMDLFGNTRILNNVVDIGCYEYLPPPASGTSFFFR